MNMELHYDITEQDFVDYNMYFIDHDLITQRTIRKMQLVLTGLVLAGGLALMYGVGTLNVVSVLVYAALAIGIYFYTPHGFKNKAKKNVHLTIKRAVNKSICGPKQLVLDDAGVRLTGEGEESTYTYDAFSRVTEAARQVYLYLDDISALIVPNSAFDNAAHKQAFVDGLRACMEQAKREKPAQADTSVDEDGDA